MTTLPEALAALDQHGGCGSSCALCPGPARGMSTNGGCECLPAHTSHERALRQRLVAVVRAARARVAQDERIDLDDLRVSCQFEPDDYVSLPKTGHGRTLEVFERDRSCAVLLSSASAHLLGRALLQWAEREDAK